MAGDQGVRFANRQSFLLNLQMSQFKIVSDLFRCVTPPQLLAIVELPRAHFDVFSRPTHTNATALNRRTSAVTTYAFQHHGARCFDLRGRQTTTLVVNMFLLRTFGLG
ncbi:hypothetical protein HanIR_Chr09g0401171 [Helianthus annuus]|nr:hypothetical protein HanIR_Chr09g0401171 [Helianthus annuus]